MRVITLIILAIITFDAYSQADRKYVRKGNRDYDDKQYQQAEIEYRKALEKNPESSRADYNLGNALYRQKQYEPAASKYANLAEKEKNKNELNRYYYNLGNARFEDKKYQESIEAYKNALKKNPGDMDAKHNLQLALRMLNAENKQKNQDKQKNKEQQQNQQQNQQQQNQQKNNDQKDQNKNEQQQGQKNNDQQQSGQQPKNVRGQISPEDAERILQALENEEKNVLKKVQEKQRQVKKVPVDKNW
jgi:tetratricopeptide (TPR) repeat protein